jgi:DNA-binding NtrC family response regulator
MPLPVLVVEDCKAVGLVLERLLANIDEDVTVHIASNSAQAKMFLENGNSFRAIFLDNDLGENEMGAGMQILEELRETGSNVPVIWISGSKFPKNCCDYGVTEMCKPFRPGKVAETFAKVVGVPLPA